MILDALGLIITWKCTARCGHCGVNCTPERTEHMCLKDALSHVDALSYVASRSSLGQRFGLSVSGGESFLYLDELETIIEYAHKKSLVVSAVTNGFWAESLEKTIALLSRLQNKGLAQLHISTDDWHSEYIGLDKVRNVIEACDRLSLNLNIKIVKNGGSRLRKATLFKMLSIEPTSSLEKGLLVIEEAALMPFGRAANLSNIVNRTDLLEGYPCKAAGATAAVTPEGAFYGCCGIGGLSDHAGKNATYLGNVREAGLVPLLELLEGVLLISLLRTIGPVTILKLAQRLDPEVKIRESYWGLCHACQDIYNPEENRRGVAKLLEYLQKEPELWKDFPKA